MKDPRLADSVPKFTPLYQMSHTVMDALFGATGLVFCFCFNLLAISTLSPPV